MSQYRLAFHLTLACAIFAAIVWTAQGLGTRAAVLVPARIRVSAIGIVLMTLAQIYLGALVAGLRAGLLYNTWPLIDGSVVPDSASLFFEKPAWRNFFENALTVQFDHRLLAYILWLVAVVHAFDVARAARGGAALRRALALAGVVTLQVVIGIVTLLHQAPLALALLHQAMAMVVLTLAIDHAQPLVRLPGRLGTSGIPYAPAIDREHAQ